MAQQVKPAGPEHTRGTLPLSGIRILDVASFIAAPVAATVLGDYGADVIKVEPLGEGDPNRTIAVVASGYPKSPVNYPWHLDSRGKRSLAIDLKHATGQHIAAAKVVQQPAIHLLLGCLWPCFRLTGASLRSLKLT
jgi:crotonobetainyl-CoA:carnitine CoA-transferase CaiB-like acyl-CoA transferase